MHTKIMNTRTAGHGTPRAMPESERPDHWPRCRLARVADAPFAPGPLEVRSAHLASIVAGCPYADEYFASLVARGVLIGDECASTDGSQGHAIGECAAELLGHLVVADADPRRQAHASSSTFALLRRAANKSAAGLQMHSRRGAAVASELTIVHPIKADRNAETWTTLWSLLARQARMRAAPAVDGTSSFGAPNRAAHSHAPISMMRVDLGSVHEGRRRPVVTTLRGSGRFALRRA